MDGQLTQPAQAASGAAPTVNRRIFSAALVVGSLTLLAKAAGMGKEMLQAAWFGTGDGMDAFLVAFLLPAYAINVIGGSINAALIPVFVEVRETAGREAAQRLFSGTVSLSLALLTAATVLLALAAPLLLPLLCPGFGPEKLQLTEQLFHLLLPAIVITGLAVNCEAALNAGERFALPALAPAIVPLVTIAALALGGQRWGIRALTAGMLAGFLLQLLILAVALRRRGLRLWPRWCGFEPELRRVMAQYVPAMVASGLVCSNLLVDQAMASTLGSGSVAALSYGNKLVALFLTIGTMALGTAVLPYFSKMAATGDWAGLRHSLRTYRRLILLITIPLAALAILLSQPLIRLLFERGNFTAADTALVVKIQNLYLLQIPAYALTVLSVRMISALQANRILVWGTVLSVLFNVLLNLALMKPLGTAGIALSSSLTQCICTAFLAWMLHRLLKAKSASLSS